MTTHVREAQEQEPNGSFEEEREQLERAAFLIYYAFLVMEQTHGGKGADGGIIAAVKRTVAKKGAKGKKAANADGDAPAVDWNQTKQAILAAQVDALELPLGARLWQLSHERDAFIGLFTKPCWSMLETAETQKETELCELIIRVLINAVMSFGQRFGTYCGLRVFFSTYTMASHGHVGHAAVDVL